MNEVQARNREFYRVWQEYQSDLARFGCAEEARKGGNLCATPLALDIFLNNLISQKEFANSAVPFSGPSDPDSNGSYSNAVRAMEE